MKRYRLSCLKIFSKHKIPAVSFTPIIQKGKFTCPLSTRNKCDGKAKLLKDTFILHVYVVLETFATSYCLFWCFNRFVKRNKRFKRKKYVLNLLLPVFNSLWRQCTSFPLKTLRIHGVCTGSSKTKLR